MASNDPSGYQGTQSESNSTAEYNAQLYFVEQILDRRNHVALVQVKAVTNAGELSPVGFVDVQPLANQITGENKPIAHGVLNQIPYFRMQGGTNAIILDPQVGDIGIAVFADRDISAVKANKGVSNPGSMRRNDMADGLYIGGVLNGKPEQYVQFSEAGIKLFSPTAIALEASSSISLKAPSITASASSSIEFTTPLFKLNGAMEASGTIKTPDAISSGKSGANHTHPGVSRGGSNTDKPA